MPLSVYLTNDVEDKMSAGKTADSANNRRCINSGKVEVAEVVLRYKKNRDRRIVGNGPRDYTSLACLSSLVMTPKVPTIEEIEHADEKDRQLEQGQDRTTASFPESVSCISGSILLNTNKAK